MDRALIVLALLAVVALAVVLLRARRGQRAPGRVEPAELGLAADRVTVVAFSSPYCRSCMEWQAALERAQVPAVEVDVAARPDLARKYRVTETPLILAAAGAEGDVLAAYAGDVDPASVARLASLTRRGPVPHPQRTMRGSLIK